MVDTNSGSKATRSAGEIFAELNLPVSESEVAELAVLLQSSALLTALIHSDDAHILLSA